MPESVEIYLDGVGIVLHRPPHDCTLDHRLSNSKAPEREDTVAFVLGRPADTPDSSRR